MELMEAIEKRRSIRRFLPAPVLKEQVERILAAAILAPSSKNRQPWRFVVVTERERPAMLAAMEQGLARMEQTGRGDPEKLAIVRFSRYTKDIMAQAPITVFVLNPHGANPEEPLDRLALFGELSNVQSVGAAIEHMCLAATALGLGSLWICDVFAAYGELCTWLDADGAQMVAAVSVGYPGEDPAPRPRMKLEELTTWR